MEINIKPDDAGLASALGITKERADILLNNMEVFIEAGFDKGKDNYPTIIRNTASTCDNIEEVIFSFINYLGTIDKVTEKRVKNILEDLFSNKKPQ